MKKYFIHITLLFAWPFYSAAQVTHGVVFQLGVVNSLYKSEVSTTKHTGTYFLPTYSFEYGKYSDNLFWGGTGIGINVRNIPFYRYSSGNSIGIELPEFWFKVKAGLHIHNEFLTHLPFISLGIGKYGNAESYYKSQNGKVFENLGGYKNYNLQSFSPFMELGTTVINSSFTENKRNVFMSFIVRYYPLPVFKTNTEIEYAVGETIFLQYHLFEISVIAGIQKNIRRN